MDLIVPSFNFKDPRNCWAFARKLTALLYFGNPPSTCPFLAPGYYDGPSLLKRVFFLDKAERSALVIEGACNVTLLEKNRRGAFSPLVEDIRLLCAVFELVDTGVAFFPERPNLCAPGRSALPQSRVPAHT